MRVLMVETTAGSGDASRQRLVEAGHEVLSCESHEPHVPCVGLSTLGVCPLDDAHVDVAVVFHAGTDLSAAERGALCAARKRVPVVVDGEFRRSVSFGPGTFVAGSDLLATCRDAAGSGVAHAAAVRRDLLCSGVLTPDDTNPVHPVVSFEVDRSPGRLHLMVRLPERDRRRTAIVKAAGEALRRFDTSVNVIDVGIDAY
jgi:hypothetical protein